MSLLPGHPSRGLLAALLAVLIPAAPVDARKITSAADAALAGASLTNFEGLPSSYQMLDSFGLTAPGVAIAVSRPVSIGQMLSCVYGPTCELIAWTGSPVTLDLTPPVSVFAIKVNEATFCSYDVTITGTSGSETFTRSGGTQPCFFDEVIGAADIGGITQVVLRELAGYKTHFDEMRLVVGAGPPVNADLGVTKAAGADVIGQMRPLSYTVTVRNAGPDAAPGASVLDLPPRGATYVGSTPPGTPAGVRVTWPLPTLAAGATQSFQLDLTTPTFREFSCEDHLVNIALVSPVGGEPVGDNLAVHIVPYDRSAAAPSEACSTDNGLDDDCDGLIDCLDSDCGTPGRCGFPALADNPPPPVPPDPLPPAAGEVCERENFFHEVVTLPAMCCGGEPCDACTSPSKAEWSFNCPPKDPNFKTADPPVNAVQLDANGHAQGGYGFAAAGQTIAYRITYENIGGSDAHDVRVIDVLDPDLDAATIAVEDGGAFDAATRTILWVDPAVPPHQPRTVRFRIALRADAPPGTRARNVATVVFPDAVPPTRIDTNFVEHIVPDPQLRAVDLAVTGCVPDGPDTWHVVLAHRGYVPAYNVSAAVVGAPESVEVVQGTATVFAHPSDSPNLHVAVPRAVTTSSDTVTLRTADGSDPCGAVRWSLCHDTPQGERACLGEVCGDCQDNDADGLVDYEDAECCPAPGPLTVLKGKLQPGKTAGPTGRLVLRTRLASGTALDPVADGLGVQLRSGTAEVVCAQLGPAGWTRKGKKKPRFRFRAPSGPAGVVSAGVTPRKAGVDVKASGRKVDLGTLAGGALTATVGSRDRCATATAGWRKKRRAFLYP